MGIADDAEGMKRAKKGMEELEKIKQGRKRRQEDQGGPEQDEEMAVEFEEEDSETEEETRSRLAEKTLEMWINEVAIEIEGEEDMVLENGLTAWDDVHGGTMPADKVEEARDEEVTYMQKRKIWSEKSIEECWRITGKEPVSVRWVDTNKGGPGEMVVRCRLVARDFKGGDKDRDDLFAETPPLEGKRLLISRAATRRPESIGGYRKQGLVGTRGHSARNIGLNQ